MKRLLTFTIVCAAVVWAHNSKPNNVPAHIAYTQHFLRNYPDRLEKAMELMPHVEGHSAMHAINSIDVVVVIACESAWRSKSTGNIGEIGLMQVHGQCAKGYNLSLPEQQIAAGVACLAASRDACDGTPRQTMMMYMTGRCKTGNKRTQWRVDRRVEIIKKWRIK